MEHTITFIIENQGLRGQYRMTQKKMNFIECMWGLEENKRDRGAEGGCGKCLCKIYIDQMDFY